MTSQHENADLAETAQLFRQPTVFVKGVVNSLGFDERTWLDQDGHPHGEQMHINEKFTRLNELSMRYEVTIDDPEFYTKPWTTSYLIPFVPGGELFEYICQENNVDGEHLVGK